MTGFTKNPFAGMSLKENYDALLSGAVGPRWPDERMQAGYAGNCGVALLGRTYQFINILERDGAFKQGWKGLDYGCGWGRFASTLLTKGTPDQLDLCDAWDSTLELLACLGYQNHIFQVPELLEPGDLPEAEYDFVLSFSVFTHLSPNAFAQNISVLLHSVKPGGHVYITVRHKEFVGHKFPGLDALLHIKNASGDPYITAPQKELIAQRYPGLIEVHQNLDRDGIVFLDSGRGRGLEKVFGDTIVEPRYLSRFGTVRYLGQPHSLQHVYAIGH